MPPEKKDDGSEGELNNGSIFECGRLLITQLFSTLVRENGGLKSGPLKAIGHTSQVSEKDEAESLEEDDSEISDS